MAADFVTGIPSTLMTDIETKRTGAKVTPNG